MTYYLKKPTSQLVIRDVKCTPFNETIVLSTASGVFSFKKVDKGSMILTRNCLMNDAWSVLDLGCGYGIIGICLKKRYPNIDLTMSDVNERAVKVTKMNLKRHNVKATVYHSEGFQKIKKKFDTILLNPPQHAGKQVCIDLIEESKRFLKKGGKLQLVVRHNVGGKHLSEIMNETFGNVEPIVRKSGFRVYMSEL